MPADKTVDQLVVNKQPAVPLPIGGPTPIPDRICYKMKCPVLTITNQEVSDQFGTRVVAGFKSSLLCTPAIKGAPTTTTTVTTTLPPSTTTTVTTTTTIPSGGPCTVNGDCNPNDYCDKALGDCGGSGICTVRPALCPLIYQPVCGCDGMTYDNACLAAKDGATSVAVNGDPAPASVRSVSARRR